MAQDESSIPAQTLAELAQQIKSWGQQLGFQQIGISAIDLSQAETRLLDWLERGFHGRMDYMARHGAKRSHPELLVPGTVRVICARMDYLPQSARSMGEALDDGEAGYVSRYALGRDYHKVIRQRLAKLCQQVEQQIGPFGFRVFTDSAPVLEKPLAAAAGLGWIGKHTNLIHRQAGSWFFLGEIYTDLPLPVDGSVSAHCGSCTRCLDICPTRAIIAPFQLDARRCISYLTIELDGPIPEEFRADLGNRIYGCDDCQWVCPWNRYARFTEEDDFQPRHQLDQSKLVDLFTWSEAEFLQRTEGSAIRRIGHRRWLRNIAVALGNAPSSSAVLQALELRRDDPDPLIQEHVLWALQQHAGRARPNT